MQRSYHVFNPFFWKFYLCHMPVSKEGMYCPAALLAAKLICTVYQRENAVTPGDNIFLTELWNSWKATPWFALKKQHCIYVLKYCIMKDTVLGRENKEDICKISLLFQSMLVCCNCLCPLANTMQTKIVDFTVLLWICMWKGGIVHAMCYFLAILYLNVL